MIASTKPVVQFDRTSADLVKVRADDSHREMVRATHGFLRSVAEISSTAVWVVEGFASLAQYLCARYQVVYSTASAWVRDAEGLKTRPDLDGAMSRGELSADQSKAIFTLTEHKPYLEGLWVEACSEKEWPIERLVREARRSVAERLSNSSDHATYLDMRTSRNEEFMELRGRLLAEDGSVVMKALDSLLPENILHDRISGGWAKSLVTMAREHLAGVQPDSNGCANVVVHCNETDLAQSRGVGESDTGEFLPMHVVRAIACDGKVSTVLHARDGEATAISNSTRRVGTKLARHVIHRDKTCQFPGCSRTRGVENHHIVHWADGGRTEAANLVLLCPTCHRHVHRTGLTAKRVLQRQVRFYRRDGTVLRF